MTDHQYTTALLNREGTGTEEMLYDLGCDPVDDPVAAAEEKIGDEAVYEHHGDGDSTAAQDRWFDPRSGVATFVDEDGGAQQYWVVGADDHRLLVGDSTGYYQVNMTSDQPQVERFVSTDEEWLEGPDYRESEHQLYHGVFEDLYDLVTDDRDDIGGAEETTGLRLQCQQAGDLTRYEQELELLEQEGEIVFDGRFSQHHNGKRRGGAVAEGLKQAFERKKLVDDVGYDIEMDSSGQHARLRITGRDE